MNRPDLNLGERDGEGYQKKGYSDLGHVIIKNSNDAYGMVDIWRCKESDRVTIIKAVLDDGSDESFPIEIKGEFYIGPAKGMLMVNMDTGDEETIVYVRKQ